MSTKDIVRIIALAMIYVSAHHFLGGWGLVLTAGIVIYLSFYERRP